MLLKYKKLIKVILIIGIMIYFIFIFDAYSNTSNEFRLLKFTDIKRVILFPVYAGQIPADRSGYNLNFNDPYDRKIISDIVKEIKFGKIDHKNILDLIHYSYAPTTFEIDLKNGNIIYIYSTVRGKRKNLSDGSYTYMPYEVKDLVTIYINKKGNESKLVREYCPETKNILVSGSIYY